MFARSALKISQMAARRMSTTAAPESASGNKSDFLVKYGPGLVGAVAAGCAFTFFITLPAGTNMKEALDPYFNFSNEGEDPYCSSQLKQCNNNNTKQ